MFTLMLSLALADEPMPIALVPEVVTATVSRQWPTAKVVHAEREDGNIELALTMDGRSFDVVLRPTGEWLVQEEAIAVAEVPAAVRAAAAVRGKIIKAERLTRATGEVDYELDLTVKGRTIEQVYSGLGELLGEEAE